MSIRHFPSWEDLNKIRDSMINFTKDKEGFDSRERVNFDYDGKKIPDGSLLIRFKDDEGKAVCKLVLEFEGVDAPSEYEFCKESYDHIKTFVEYLDNTTSE